MVFVLSEKFFVLLHRAVRWCSFVLLITILGTLLPGAVPLAAQSFTVLFVTGSPTLNAGDAAVQTRLQGLGYTVIVKDHVAATTADATGKSIVLISATVSAGNVGTKFRDVAVPVLLWETALYDDMGMTGTAVGPDYGTSTTTTEIVINNPSHPLAAGLTGTQTIFPTVQGLSYGTPASTGAIVALMGTSTTKAVLFAYNTNATMVSQTAPARRVGFFFNNDSAASMNATGWQLFDAAITWSVGASTPTPTATISPPTATISPPTATTNPSTPTSLPVGSGTVLFVVGVTPLSAADAAVKARIESLGYTVEVKTASAVLTSDANGKQVVVISSTVTSGNVGTKFKTVAIPVVLWENGLYDSEMGMTGTTVGTNYGTTSDTTTVTIVNAAHSLAAGLTGTVAVVSTARAMPYGVPNANAVVIAQATSNNRSVIFGYDTNAQMVDGVAAARRVGIFLNDDTATLLTINGWNLFDAAILWAAGTAPATTPTPTSVPSATSTVVGPTVTVTQPTATSTVVGPTATVIQPTATIIQPTATPGPITKSALFVVGSTQLTASDSAVQARLQGLGYTVVVRDQAASTTADATGKTIILISATVNSGSVNTKFRDVRVPVITWEHGLYDDMKMTGTLLGPDYGNASASEITTQINLADPTQPITAGLTGTQTVFTTAQPLPFGLTATTGQRVALLQNSNTKAVLFAYDLYTSMVGMTAPARRVGFFLSETGATSIKQRQAGSCLMLL